MLAFPANSEIFVIHEPVSFARGIDGMGALCRALLDQEPLSSAYFLFINKGRTQMRALWFDGQGFSLCTKRLSQGSFRNWPKASAEPAQIVRWFEAQILVGGGCIEGLNHAHIWKELSETNLRN